jgi:hypothetical protein
MAMKVTIVTNVEDGSNVLGVYKSDEYAHYLHGDNDRNHFTYKTVDENEIPESIPSEADMTLRDYSKSKEMTREQGGKLDCCSECGYQSFRTNKESGEREPWCTNFSNNGLLSLNPSIYEDGTCTEFTE